MRKISTVLIVAMFLSGAGFVDHAYAKMLSPIPVCPSEKSNLQAQENCVPSSMKNIRAGDSSTDAFVGVLAAFFIVGGLIAMAANNKKKGGN